MKQEFKSLVEKEFYLNNYYSDNFTIDKISEKFDYLTSRDRKIKTTRQQIWKSYHKRKLGTMLRRLDITAFKLF